MFGFLNVFLTAAFVRGGMPREAALALLLEKDIERLRVSTSDISWGDHTITADDLRATRDCLAVSFGSCS